jgi:shikimate kinase
MARVNERSNLHAEAIAAVMGALTAEAYGDRDLAVELLSQIEAEQGMAASFWLLVALVEAFCRATGRDLDAVLRSIGMGIAETVIP